MSIVQGNMNHQASIPQIPTKIKKLKPQGKAEVSTSMTRKKKKSKARKPSEEFLNIKNIDQIDDNLIEKF